MRFSGAIRSHIRRDESARISALHAVSRVPKLRHQFGEGVRDAVMGPPLRTQRVGEAMPRKGRDHKVEGISGFASMSLRVGEWSDHVEKLDERSRPAVNQQERRGVRLRRANVQEMQGLP